MNAGMSVDPSNSAATVMRGRFARFDTRALVGSVFLGIVFVLVQQVAHRIDALINPASVIVGGITWAAFTGLVVLLFRQPAGFITGEVAAFMALATGLSPLAPFFLAANGLGSLAYSLASWKLTMDRWSHHLAAQVCANIVGNVCVAVGLRVLLHLPYEVILVAASITTLAGVIGGALLTRWLHGHILRSGVLS